MDKRTFLKSVAIATVAPLAVIKNAMGEVKTQPSALRRVNIWREVPVSSFAQRRFFNRVLRDASFSEVQAGDLVQLIQVLEDEKVSILWVHKKIPLSPSLGQGSWALEVESAGKEFQEHVPNSNSFCTTQDRKLRWVLHTDMPRSGVWQYKSFDPDKPNEAPEIHQMNYKGNV